MKKWMVGMVTAALVLSVAAVCAFAAPAGQGYGEAGQGGAAELPAAETVTSGQSGIAGTGTGAVNAGPGVCGGPGCQFVDADGNGICDLRDSCGSGQGGGCYQSCPDADCDGVCGNVACRPRDGTGLRRGCSAGSPSGCHQGHHGGRGR